MKADAMPKHQRNTNNNNKSSPSTHPSSTTNPTPLTPPSTTQSSTSAGYPSPTTPPSPSRKTSALSAAGSAARDPGSTTSSTSATACAWAASPGCFGFRTLGRSPGRRGTRTPSLEPSSTCCARAVRSAFSWRVDRSLWVRCRWSRGRWRGRRSLWRWGGWGRLGAEFPEGAIVPLVPCLDAHRRIFGGGCEDFET